MAARYYQKQGYLLLEHGYRTRLGELDLILYKDHTLVVAEVKARRNERFGRPSEAVTPQKQKRILLATRQYLAQSPFAAYPVRFDVVEVTPVPGGGCQVHCIRDAFTISDNTE